MLGEIRIVNVRDRLTRNFEYVGRARKDLPGSPLANPFRMNGEADRAKVIEQYRRWLWQQCQSDTPAYRELMRLVARYQAGQTIRLACWCFPKRCHAQVIKRAILYFAKKVY